MPSKSMNPMPMQTKIGDASLKFGPDWLRALSSDNSTGSTVSTSTGGGQSGGGWSSGSGGGGGSGERVSNERGSVAPYRHQPTRDREKEVERRYSNQNSSSNNAGGAAAAAQNRFKLAEFRYAREELLTLYDKNLQAPPFLASFGTLFMEKMQPPLAFSQPSEEELRPWLATQPEPSRLSANGPVGPGMSPLSRGGGFAARGRGIDRGGRGGRGGRTMYYARLHEEDDQRFRQHSFSRSVSAHERNWGTDRERNGLAGSPPETESNRSGGGGGNWRNRNSDSYSKSRYEDNDDGWRSKPRWRQDYEEDYGPPPRNNTRRVHKSWSEDVTQENLPEWAKDNPSEESGTFDSSGAFHDEDRYSAKTNAFEISRRSDAGDHPKDPKENSQGSQNERVQKRNTERGEAKPPLRKTSLREEDEDEEPRPLSNQKTRTSASPRSEPSKEPQVPLQEKSKQSPNESKKETPAPPQQASKPVDEEHYRSMIEEADSLVAKLIEDDAALSHLQRATDPPIPPVSSVNVGVAQAQPTPPPVQPSKDIWFYRDPQGNVQGPFASTEMSLWLNQGYFSSGLFLRRECDKLFVTLGEMGKLYGRNPFTSLPDVISPPPLQEPSNGMSALDPLVGEAMHPAQAQFLQHKQHLLQAQQQQYLLNFLQHSQQRKDNEDWPGAGGPSSSQFQQAQLLLNNIAKAGGGMAGSDGTPFDLQSFFQRHAQLKAQEKAAEFRNTNVSSQIPLQNEGKSGIEMDPIQSLLHQLTNMNLPNTQGQGAGLKTGGNSWNSAHAGTTSWNAPSTVASNPLWDYRDQFVKMQQMKAEEELLTRKKIEEEQERKRIQEEEETRKRIEEQKRIEMEQEQKLKAYEELMQQQQAAAAELARQREELIIQQRLQQQEMARQRLEQERQLEKQRIEALQKLEQQRAEQQRMEQARLEKEREEEKEREREREREEQERRAQLQMEEQRKREERRQQQEMQVKKMQEYQQQQKVPWNTSSSQAPRTLLEIQEEETLQMEALKAQQLAQKKKLEEEQREQRLSQQQSKGLSLTWAQSSQPQNVPIKSLAEIQAEEAAKLEEKRREKEIQTRHLNIQQSWNASLTWANRASLNAPPSTGKGNSGGSVWEDARKKWDETPATTSNKLPPHSSTSAVGNSKQRQKEPPADDSFLKLFQDHGVSVGGTRNVGSGRSQALDDSFTRWCFETVEGIGGSVDVPTFINFLKEVESPYEVNDYIRSYLGDGKDARDFGREFLERRSRWKNARRGGEKEEKSFEDNLYRPASALNPPNAEFQEVKGKKGKKGKMQKVDARILGFNMTAAPDRLNVGKRDYGDGSDN